MGYSVPNFTYIYIYMICVVKIGVNIATHLCANISTYALRARYIFLTGKNMAALSELILQMVTYFHAGSHVKPWSVKTRMQMGAGRKKHKPTNVVTWGFLCLRCILID